MNKKHRIIPIFISHRGCPQDCVFCNQKRIAQEVPPVTGEEVQKILNEMLPPQGMGEGTWEVAFYGGSFTGLPLEHQRELLTPAYQGKLAGKVHAIRLSTRPDYITPEILQQLKAYGVTTIELGVQSTDDVVLRRSNRGHNKEAVDRGVQLIRSYGFFLGLQMMVGLPGETPEAFDQTVTDFINYRPDFVRIYPTLVIKDTDLERAYLAGTYQPLTLEESIVRCQKALEHFEAHGIPVIRLGLQATDEIRLGKGVVAGPYHPAFRELVESRVTLRRILKILEEQAIDHPRELVIHCHPQFTSRVAGYRQQNKAYLKQALGIQQIRILKDGTLVPGALQIKVSS